MKGLKLMVGLFQTLQLLASPHHHKKIGLEFREIADVHAFSQKIQFLTKNKRNTSAKIKLAKKFICRIINKLEEFAQHMGYLCMIFQSTMKMIIQIHFSQPKKKLFLN